MLKSVNLLKTVQNRRGATAVIVAICLVMLIGFAALAIDVGFLYSTRNELQNVADAAALAGAGYLGSEYGKLSYADQQERNFTFDEVAGVVKAVAIKNKAAGVSISISDGDIVIGNWTHDEATDEWHVETKYEDGKIKTPDAVRVTARRKDGINGAISTFFARIFKIFDVNVGAVATAALTGTSHVDPGELKVPFGVSENIMEDCTDLITFYPTQTSCAGWHNYGLNVNAAGMAENMLNIIQSHICGDGGDPCGTTTEGGYPLESGADWLANNFDLNNTPEGLVTGGDEGFDIGDPMDHTGGADAKLFNGAVLDPSTEGGNNPDNYGTYTDPSMNPKIPAPFFALFDYFRYRDGDLDWYNQDTETWIPADQVWTATVPVYEDDPDCVNPGRDMIITDFVTIKVLMPNPPPDKTIDVYIDCEDSVTEGRGGGGTGPLKGTIPQLVE
jgi:hypothetical protein